MSIISIHDLAAEIEYEIANCRKPDVLRKIARLLFRVSCDITALIGRTDRDHERIGNFVKRLDALEKRVNQEKFEEWYVKKVQESMEGAMADAYADACADALRQCAKDSFPWTSEREPVPSSNPAPRPAPTTTTPSDPLAEASRRVVILRITDLSKGTTHDESIYNSGRLHVVGKDLEVTVE